MCVGAQIAEHKFRATKRPLGVDDPIVSVRHSYPGFEGRRLGKRYQSAVELELALMESVTKSRYELAPEDNTKQVTCRKDRVQQGSKTRLI
jgi:hypothetical protein